MLCATLGNPFVILNLGQSFGNSSTGRVLSSSCHLPCALSKGLAYRYHFFGHCTTVFVLQGVFVFALVLYCISVFTWRALVRVFPSAQDIITD